MMKKDSASGHRVKNMEGNKENIREKDNLDRYSKQPTDGRRNRSRTPLNSISSRGLPESSTSRGNISTLLKQVSVRKNDFGDKSPMRNLKIKRSKVDRPSLPQTMSIQSSDMEGIGYWSDSDCKPRRLNVKAENMEMLTARIMEINCREGLPSDTDRMFGENVGGFSEEPSFIDQCSFDQYFLQTIERSKFDSTIKRRFNVDDSKVDSLEEADCVNSLVYHNEQSQKLIRQDSCYKIVCQSDSELSFRAPFTHLDNLPTRLPLPSYSTPRHLQTSFMNSSPHQSQSTFSNTTYPRDFPSQQEPSLHLPSQQHSVTRTSHKAIRRHYSIRSRQAIRSSIDSKYQSSILTCKCDGKMMLIDKLKNYR